jgi:NADH-quinone oxidoreductase subunit C
MSKITNEEIIGLITAKFGDTVVIHGEPYGLLTVETSREQIISLLTFLKADATLKFGFLTDITAIHYPELEKQIGVIYHLHSLQNNIRIRIKVFMADGDVRIPTRYNFMGRR